MREKLRYTPTHAVQQEPMKSAREGNCFRLVSDGVVHRSRTITRTESEFHRIRLLSCHMSATRMTSDRMPIPTNSGRWGIASVMKKLYSRDGYLGRVEPFFAKQGNHGCDGQNTDRNTVSPQFSREAHSDCIPDVLLQVFGFVKVICDCPRTVRVLEGAARGN
jgi:hypothetical protein